MARIFVNYRRGDAPGYAGRLADDLEMHFGPENVSGDFLGQRASADFRLIERAVYSADVFLVLIGTRWFEPDARGRRWVDDPDDHVRREIEAALDRRSIRVIPVLVDDAQMPREEDLPTEIRPLTRRRTFLLRDVSWQDDVARLISALERIDRPDERAEAAPPMAEAAPPVAEAAPPGRRRSSTRKSKPKTSAPKSKPKLLEGLGRRAPPDGPISIGSERPLSSRLRDAALAGVVPEAVATSLRDPLQAPGDVVACTVFAPPSAAPGQMILVQAFAHLPKDAGKAANDAKVFDSEAVMRTYQSLELPVPRGGRLDFELRRDASCLPTMRRASGGFCGSTCRG